MYIKTCPHCNNKIELTTTAHIAVCPYCKKEIKEVSEEDMAGVYGHESI